MSQGTHPEDPEVRNFGIAHSRELAIEEIRRLDAILDEVPEVEFADRLARQGLRAFRAQLVEQVTAQGVLTVGLGGAGVVDHDVDAGIASRILRSIYDAILRTGQALRGDVRAGGAVPAVVRRAASFTLTAVAPGSVELVLRAPPEAITGNEIPGIVSAVPREGLGGQSAERLLSIFIVAGEEEGDDSRLIESIAPLGPLVVKALRELVDAAEQGRLDLTFNFIGREREIYARMPFETVRRLRNALEFTMSNTTIEVVTGRLAEVSDIRDEFGLLRDGGEVLKGRVRADVRQRYGELLRRHVRATVETYTVTVPATGRRRRQYLLVGIEPISG